MSSTNSLGYESKNSTQKSSNPISASTKSTTSEPDIKNDPLFHPNNWIHCFKCYELYVLKTRRFILLSCDHIFCENCVKTMAADTPQAPPVYCCSLCKKGMQGCAIGNDMPAQLKLLFHPKFWEAHFEIHRILTFREKHYEHLAKFLENSVSRHLAYIFF